jgi:hypothetical protein
VSWAFTRNPSSHNARTLEAMRTQGVSATQFDDRLMPDVQERAIALAYFFIGTP